MSLAPKIVYVCATVLQKPTGEILLVQRPAHKPLGLMWEFPGGKVEPGETPQQTAVREAEEEIGLHINAEDLEPYTFLSQKEEWGHMVMLVFHCRRWQGEVTLKEGQPDSKWVAARQLRDYLIPEADLPIIKRLEQEANIL